MMDLVEWLREEARTREAGSMFLDDDSELAAEMVDDAAKLTAVADELVRLRRVIAHAAKYSASPGWLALQLDPATATTPADFEPAA